MKPIFKLEVNGKDVTALFNDRVIKIQTVDKPGLDSDECEITIDDRDGKVAFPSRRSTISIALGYDGAGLSHIGTYKVISAKLSGPPRSIIVKGEPANVIATMKNQRRFSWENTSLKSVVNDIAARNNLKPLCSIDIQIPRIDQMNESDMHFMTRVARANGGTATVKDGSLIVAQRGAGKSGSGRDIPVSTVHVDEMDSYDIEFSDRPLYGKFQAKHRGADGNNLKTVEVDNESAPAGSSAPTYTERHTYPNAEAAQAAVNARKSSLNRATADGSFELAKGRSDLAAERHIKITGLKPEIEQSTFAIETVTHTYDQKAWRTKVDFNAGNTGKSKVGKKNKPATKIVTVEK